MTHTHGISTAVRQAALTVHALSDADRTWLLDALPAHEREQLGALVEELRALGIPQDSALVGEIARSSPPATGQGDWLSGLDARGMQALETVLRGESAELRRTALAIFPEDARRQLLDALGPTHEQGAELPAAPAPALVRALRAAIEPRWKTAAQQANVNPVSRWSFVRTRIAKLGRFS